MLWLYKDHRCLGRVCIWRCGGMVGSGEVSEQVVYGVDIHIPVYLPLEV